MSGKENIQFFFADFTLDILPYQWNMPPTGIQSQMPHRSFYSCKLCPRAFHSPSELDQHILLSHPGGKLFECHICHKNFPRKSNLMLHLKWHEKEESSSALSATSSKGEGHHKCEYCNKTFSDTGNFGRHLMTHTGEKPFQCEICYKAFSRKFILQRHMVRIHGKNDENGEKT